MKRQGRIESLGSWIAAASFVVFGAMVADTALAAIAQTKHNLGSTGSTSNTVYTNDTSEICVFCHTPHGGNTSASAPLWNRGAAATTTFTLYDGAFGGGRPPSLDGEVLQPTAGAGSISALCLSCHDGVTALDLMINKPGSGGFNSAGASAGYTWNQTIGGANGITNIGADLRNDHPIGVAYCGGKKAGTDPTSTANCNDPDFNAATKATINSTDYFYVDAPAGAGGTVGQRDKTDMQLYVRTFAASGSWPSVECGSCHDPHSTNATFLRMANTGSQLCLTCHAK